MLSGLLGAGEEHQAVWRARLAQAVGTNGRLIAEIVPELELFLGPQPPLTPLPPLAAAERFAIVFHAFITAFGTPERPLVLFLDDLQWADIASLRLVRSLLTTPDTQNLLVFGAYRDTDIDATHVLPGALNEIRQAGVRVEEMVLGTLTVEHVVAFASDAVRRPAEEVRPLARLVQDKTAGNPFFVIQFFRELVRGGLLFFDAGAWRWRWDLGRIREQGYSDDVAQFIAGRIAPPPGRYPSGLAARGRRGEHVRPQDAGGGRARGQSADRARSSPGRRAGAARSQPGAGGLPVRPRSRSTRRLCAGGAGRAACAAPAHRAPPPRGDTGGGGERPDLRGRQPAQSGARVARAGGAAPVRRARPARRPQGDRRGRLRDGQDLPDRRRRDLPPGGWEKLYELSFALHLEAARAAFFAGEPEEAGRQLRELHGHARRPQDEAAVATLEVYLLTVQGRLAEAVEVMRSALRHYGLDLPTHPAWEEITGEVRGRSAGDRRSERPFGERR